MPQTVHLSLMLMGHSVGTGVMHCTTPIRGLHSKPLWALDGVTVVFMSRAGVAGHAKLTAVQQDAILQPGEDLLERDKSQKHEQRSPCPKRTA